MGVIHPDISPRNILIVGVQGILINWDLSKWLKEPKCSADMYDVDDCQTECSTDRLHADNLQTCCKGDTVRQPTQMVCTNTMQ